MPQLKNNLKIYLGVPWLRDDHFQKYFKRLQNHVNAQETDVEYVGPYKTPTVGRKANLEPGTQELLDAICDRMNAVVDMFMRTNCTHLWMLDADVEPPPHALETLLRLDVDVASGLYPRHSKINGQVVPVAGRMSPDNPCGGFVYRGLEYALGQVHGEEQPWSAGAGCLLIKRRVFKRWNPKLRPIRFIRSDGVRKCGADTWFWKRCRDAGFTTRVDGRVLCGHLPEYSLSKIDEWLG